MRNNKFLDSLKGKGYYIALGLCAVAIGISGYLYYQNTNNEADDPKIQVSVTTPDITEDGPSATNPPDATKPQQSDTKLPLKPTRPVSGDTVAGYAMEALQYNQTTRDWRVHNGIDIAAQAGTEVLAAADGTVYTVFEDDTMGTTVVLRHDGGYVTKYASLDKAVSVTVGQHVTSGTVIGKVGNTALLETAIGDHLHFSVTCDGKSVDPEAFLNLS